MDFRTSIGVKDNWPYIGVDRTSEHAIPGQGKYWHNPCKYRRDARAPCSKQALAHAVTRCPLSVEFSNAGVRAVVTAPAEKGIALYWTTHL